MWPAGSCLVSESANKASKSVVKLSQYVVKLGQYEPDLRDPDPRTLAKSVTPALQPRQPADQTRLAAARPAHQEQLELVRGD